MHFPWLSRISPCKLVILPNSLCPMYLHSGEFLVRKEIMIPRATFHKQIYNYPMKEGFIVDRVGKAECSTRQQQAAGFVGLQVFWTAEQWAQRIPCFSLLPSSVKTKCAFWSSLSFAKPFIWCLNSAQIPQKLLPLFGGLAQNQPLPTIKRRNISMFPRHHMSWK